MIHVISLCADREERAKFGRDLNRRREPTTSRTTIKHPRRRSRCHETFPHVRRIDAISLAVSGQTRQSPQQHGIHMQEIDRDWACRNCRQVGPERRGAGSMPAARRISHGGRRDRHAQFREFAVDPAVSPQRILLRQADDKAGDAGTVGGRPGLRRLLTWYLFPPACVARPAASRA